MLAGKVELVLVLYFISTGFVESASFSYTITVELISLGLQKKSLIAEDSVENAMKKQRIKSN